MEEVIVIGIDFGTTYSGVAWAYSLQPENIEVVTSWESELNHCSDLEKTPTQLAYGKKGEPVKWGYTVPSNAEAVQWFKLLLLNKKDVDPDVYWCSQFCQAREMLDDSDENAVQMVASFLKPLWFHAIKSIKEELGEELLLRCQFHVIMTLPAIWPQYAQQRMEEAAKIAGILTKRSCGSTVLRFISEPEAAALATIKDLSKRSTIEIGDIIIVCDAGGGTVDLISYTVDSKTPFALKECVKGEGDLCGGVFLDENFIKLIKDKVPGSWKKVSKQQERKFLNDNWEHGIKPQFRDKPHTWVVDLPDAAATSKKRSRGLQLSTSEISTAFEPIVRKIEKLVQGQTLTIMAKYGRVPKYVVLVGGFGRSPYLYDRLSKLVNGDTTVLQSKGSKPWVAICRGAVVHGISSLDPSQSLGIKVESRVARMSYGISNSEVYDSKRHLSIDKYYDNYELTWMARNQMSWFLKQGCDLSGTTCERRWFCRTYDSSVNQVAAYEDFYVSYSSMPPSRKTASVTKLCKVKWNKTIQLDSLRIQTNILGTQFRYLDYEIEMTCDGRSLDFAVYYEGERVAEHNVSVDYDLE